MRLVHSLISAYVYVASVRNVLLFISRQGTLISHCSLIDPERYEAIECIQPKFWCSVSYYEMKNRVGGSFDAATPFLTVDGFTNPSSDNCFCLGQLTNSQRDQHSIIEKVRRRIGKGISLLYTGGKVYVESLTEDPVFMQSPSFNFCQHWPSCTVVKIPPG